MKKELKTLPATLEHLEVLNALMRASKSNWGYDEEFLNKFMHIFAEASFFSLSEPWADTTSHAGKMIMTIFAGIAEFERDLIRERTSAGRVAAKQRGIRFGRPKKMNEEQKLLAKRLLEENKSVSEVAKTFNVHKATIYRLQNC